MISAGVLVADTFCGPLDRLPQAGELQYVRERELAALIAALHRAAQCQLPVTLIGAGLPQLVARAASAKS